MNKIVYNVYENFHHSDGEVGNYNYGTYSTLELAQARMEQVWAVKKYPTDDIEKYSLEWYYFDENMQTVYCIIIEELVIVESLEYSKTMTNVTMIALPPVGCRYLEL